MSRKQNFGDDAIELLFERERERMKTALLKHNKAAEDHQRQVELTALWRNVHDLKMNFPPSESFRPEVVSKFFGQWVLQIANYVEAIARYDMLSRFDTPPAGVTGEQLDAYRLAVEIYQKSVTNRSEAEAILCKVVGWSIWPVVNEWLRRGLHDHVEGRNRGQQERTEVLNESVPDHSVDVEDIEILKAMKAMFPKLCTGYDIAENAVVGRKTVGKRLKELIAKGLAIKTKGRNGGTTITHAGIALLAKCSDPK